MTMLSSTKTGTTAAMTRILMSMRYEGAEGLDGACMLVFIRLRSISDAILLRHMQHCLYAS